jgi:hypothetical protein
MGICCCCCRKKPENKKKDKIRKATDEATTLLDKNNNVDYGSIVLDIGNNNNDSNNHKSNTAEIRNDIRLIYAQSLINISLNKINHSTLIFDKIHKISLEVSRIHLYLEQIRDVALDLNTHCKNIIEFAKKNNYEIIDTIIIQIKSKLELDQKNNVKKFEFSHTLDENFLDEDYNAIKRLLYEGNNNKSNLRELINVEIYTKHCVEIENIYGISDYNKFTEYVNLFNQTLIFLKSKKEIIDKIDQNFENIIKNIGSVVDECDRLCRVKDTNEKVISLCKEAHFKIILFLENTK